MDRFKKEALQLMQFRDDPGVVRGLSFFRANGTAYFVMDYVDGMSLAELLRERESAGRPLDESELVSFVMPLLDTLSDLHREDVLHRDLKPSNILVRRSDGRPVLIDFGAAKQGAAVHSKSAAPFTEGYAALEQVSDGRLGPWTDLYAVGAVMWRVVAGSNPPWTPPNPKRVELRAAAALSGRPDPMPSATVVGKGQFSRGLLQAVDSCLEVRPESRMRSCNELKQKMGEVATAGERAPNLPEQGRDSDGDDSSNRVRNPAPQPRTPAPQSRTPSRRKQEASTQYFVSWIGRFWIGITLWTLGSIMMLIGMMSSTLIVDVKDVLVSKVSIIAWTIWTTSTVIIVLNLRQGPVLWKAARWSALIVLFASICLFLAGLFGLLIETSTGILLIIGSLFLFYNSTKLFPSTS